MHRKKYKQNEKIDALEKSYIFMKKYTESLKMNKIDNHVISSNKINESECYKYSNYIERFLRKFGLKNFQMVHSFGKNKPYGCDIDIEFDELWDDHFKNDKDIDNIYDIHKHAFKSANNFYEEYISGENDIEIQSILVTNDSQCKLYESLLSEYLYDLDLSYHRRYIRRYPKMRLWWKTSYNCNIRV